jgi:hypothetical protein
MRQLSTMQRVRRGALVAVLALVGAFVLTGCRSEPGIAAYVGDEKITVDRVDAVFNAVDQVNAGRTAEVEPGPIPISRQFVLSLIVYGDLAQQVMDQKSLKESGQFLDIVAQNYGLPLDHPYTQLLGRYLDRINVLRHNAGSAQPPREGVLRYYQTLVGARLFTPGLSDDEAVQSLNQPLVVADLNVQATLADLGNKTKLTINPRYEPLSLPLLIAVGQQTQLAELPFGPTGQPFVTDVSEGGS